MAKPKKSRKPEPIEKLLNKDYHAFKAFRACGHLSKDHFEQLGIGASRIKRWEASGWIKEVVWNRNDGSRVRGYQMTRDGYRFAKEKLFYEGFYSPQSLGHDLKLADVYFNCTQEQRDSWITEKQQQDEFIRLKRNEEIEINNDEKYSACDGGYIDEQGQTVYIEIITSAYSAEERASKVSFSSAMGGTLREVRA